LSIVKMRPHIFFFGGSSKDGDIILRDKDGNHKIEIGAEEQDIKLLGADCAEDFDLSKSDEIEPGTVLVIDQESKLRQSTEAYDKRVAGVVSGAGDYRPGIVLDGQRSRKQKAPVALTGKVYCKVDAQYSPIEVGDLLTTSPTPGYAIKAEDSLKAFGTVIGEALTSFKDGTGLIPILVALQ